jgi:cell division protein FtsB
MIQINLLPPEYRPRSGTPMTRFAAIVAGVVLVASASGVYAYTHFIDLARVRELKSARTEELSAKTRLRDRSLALQREISVYEKRREAIQKINGSRTLWSRKLDQFFDVVTAQGQEASSSYLVWLETAEVPTQLSSRSRRGAARGNRAPPAGEFRFDGHLAMERDSEALALSSLFHLTLTGDPEVSGSSSEFFADFESVTNPGMEMQMKNNEEGMTPPLVGDFKYRLRLHPVDYKTKKAAAAKAAAAGR